MCINLETSVASFLIGEIFGFKLFSSNKKELKVLGIFVMWVSLVQLWEACLYYFDLDHQKFYYRLLLLSLGLQGFVMFQAHYKIMNQKHFLHILILIISVIITYKSLSPNFKVNKSNCIDWNFSNHDKLIGKLLFTMYICILLIMSTNKTYSIYRNYLLICYFFSYYIIPHNNKPSLWCLTSALVTPIFYYFN
jgi:hypothetical protein